MKFNRPIAHLIQEQRSTLLLPATWIASLAGIVIIVQAIDPRLDSRQRLASLVAGTAVIAYS